MGHYETVDKHHTVLFECCADSAHTVYLLPNIDTIPLKQQLPCDWCRLKSTSSDVCCQDETTSLLTSTLCSGEQQA